MNRDIYWICSECANENNGQWPPGHVATFHGGVCDVCKQSKTVTEPRDYCLNRDLTRREKPSLYDIYLAQTEEREKKN